MSFCEIHSASEDGWAQSATGELAKALSAAGEPRSLAAGEALFSYGDAAGGIFLVRHGSLRASLPGRAGRELMRSLVGPGSVLGLSAALCSRSYQCDAVALEPVELTYLPTAQLNDLLRGKPEVGMQAMAIMCDEMSALRQTREHLGRCQNHDCGLHGFCQQVAAEAN